MKSYDEYRNRVESSLEAQMDSMGNIPEVLRSAMLYSLMAGGKRLRPVLLMAAADAARDGASEEALPFACALEMIHTYSLIHDDLPAMDNDDLRRGKPTNHCVYGEAMAILAGDGLLHAAMQLLFESALRLNRPEAVRAAECIARRSGITGMVAGQVMDVTGEGSEPTLEKVSYIHEHKTADLLTAPMEAGLWIGGADPDLFCAGQEFGHHFGLAFQIEDDLLDLEGDEARLGKKTGLDAAAGKLTWIAVRGAEGARQDAKLHLGLALEAAEKMGENGAFFGNIAKQSLGRTN